MTRHPRDFPGASYDAWKTTNPADAELGPEPDADAPEMEECQACGKRFEAEYDNFIMHLTGSHPYCDRCISLGAPWERPDRD